MRSFNIPIFNKIQFKLFNMNLNYAYKNRKLILVLFLLTISQSSVWAQTAPAETKGYGKASYDASQTGKFMKTWLVAGPVSITADNAKPDAAIQEKVFKTDIISAVNVVSVNPGSTVSVNQ